MEIKFQKANAGLQSLLSCILSTYSLTQIQCFISILEEIAFILVRKVMAYLLNICILEVLLFQ